MELSGATLANWQAKVANLLTSIGVLAGDAVAVAAAPGWQPAVIAIGAWRLGVSVVDFPPAPGTAPLPKVLFTDSIELAEEYEDSDVGAHLEEIYVLSTDPFGRGIEESGGELPFGLNDFSPELRVQPDAFMGRAVAEMNDGDAAIVENYAKELTLAPNARILTGAWSTSAGLKRCLSPLAVGGSVVVSTDTSAQRLEHLAEAEKSDRTLVFSADD